MVFVEDFYTVVHEVHEKELFHAGHHKTNEKVGLIIMCMLAFRVTSSNFSYR